MTGAVPACTAQVIVMFFDRLLYNRLQYGVSFLRCSNPFMRLDTPYSGATDVTNRKRDRERCMDFTIP